MTIAPDRKLTLARRGLRAVLKGLIGCHRLDCPVCGPKVAESEAAKIGLAVVEHYARGGQVAMVTLTLRHVRAQALLTLLGGLGKAWRSCTDNRAPRALWASLTDGLIRKLEVTFGRNGWHPHLHLLVFLKPGVGEGELEELCETVFGAWSSRLVRLGLGEPTRERGIDSKILDLDQAVEEVGKYLGKDAGRELASAGTKVGKRDSYTTYDLLVGAATGLGCTRNSLKLSAEEAGWRFLEYEEAMRNKHRIEWSQGLEERLIDPELVATADPDSDASDIAVFTDEGSRMLIRNERYELGPGLAAVIKWANVHEDDWDAFSLVARQCLKHGIPPPTPASRLGPVPDWVTADLRAFSGPVQPAQIALW